MLWQPGPTLMLGTSPMVAISNPFPSFVWPCLLEISSAVLSQLLGHVASSVFPDFVLYFDLHILFLPFFSFAVTLNVWIIVVKKERTFLVLLYSIEYSTLGYKYKILQISSNYFYQNQWIYTIKKETDWVQLQTKILVQASFKKY